MSIVKNILIEELERQQQIEVDYIKKLENLPKGSVQIRVRGGQTYYYLHFRDGKKVVSRYIKMEDLPELRHQISKRREIEKMIRQVRANMHELRSKVKPSPDSGFDE